MISIRRFLLVAIASVVIGTTVIVTLATYFRAYHEVDELFDAQLVQNARLIALLSSDKNYQLDPTVMHKSGPGHAYERYIAVQRWSNDGQLLLASESVPEKPLAAFEPGLSRTRIDDAQWHVFTQQLPNTEWLMVAEAGRARADLVRGSALAVVAPFLIAIPVLLLLVAAAIRRGLQPLSVLLASVRERDHHNLQPLDTAARNVRELAPLEMAINSLMMQLQDALSREQRFTADAAHELRTLLTVLKLHADNARTLKDPEEVRLSLLQLQAGVDRATRMVAQLLALARIDPQSHDALLQTTSVLPVVRQVLADLMPLAGKRAQSVLLDEAADTANVALRSEALDILLRNLVENALRYSPSGSEVQVAVSRHAQSVDITVQDEGEGISAELSERVQERFFRGHHDSQGAGLGLSIVSRILQLAGGSLSFSPKAEGQSAHVVVTLPLA